MTMSKRYAAGCANYPGDQSHIVGEIKGPTTYGTAAVAIGADYDADTDRTRVAFAHCAPEDVPAERDADGILRLPTLQAVSE
jgi:hypothetical protein